MKVLEVNNISKRIRKKQILDDVSFFLCGGELDRIETAPESSNALPVHKDLFDRSNLNKYLNKRSEVRKILDNLYDKYGTQIDKIMEKAYNLFNKEGLSNEEIDLLVKEYQKEVEEKDSKNDLQNILRRRPTLERTSDSSFSLEQGLENQASNIIEDDDRLFRKFKRK